LKVARSMDELEPAVAEELSVTIGNFDGVHLGHRAVLAELVARPHAGGRRRVAVTFEPHPLSVVDASRTPALLTPLDEKVEVLAGTGLDSLLVVRFTEELAAADPREFLQSIGLGSGSHLVLGYNFRMGRDRCCDVARLSVLGAEMGYGLDVVPPVQYDDRPISSSRIREQLDAGDVVAAAAMLGRPYSISGTVVAGDGKGRTLDVPTANLSLPAMKLVPGDGVYLIAADGRLDRPGLLYVGARPTFGAADTRIEVHLLDLDADLYGADLSVSLLRRLRRDVAFGSAEELGRQLKKDIEHARHIMSRLKENGAEA
jgi:riboflavin kinase/FMN adenylyltransferase